MFWLPPVLFSTTTGWFQLAWRFCASTRAMVSGEPPGGSGTTMRTGRSGKLCASAPTEKSATSAAASQRFTFSPRMLQRAVYLLVDREYDERPLISPEEQPPVSPNHRRSTLLASALLSFAVPSWSQDVADRGKAMVDAQCNSCHPIGARVGSGYTLEGWKTVMRMMTNHGVAIPPDQIGPMTDYLAKTYPVKGRPDAVVVPGPVKVSMKAWQAATPGSRPHDPMAARDGSLWDSRQMANVLGRLDPKSGEIKLLTPPTPKSRPYGVALDSKDSLFVVQFGTNRIVRVDPKSLEMREYVLPDAESRPRRLTITSDDMIWYSDYSRGYLGRLDPKTGAVKEWQSPSAPKSAPYGISPIQNVIWYSESGGSPDTVVRFDPKTEKFQSWAIPGGGNIVRNTDVTKDGNFVLANSLTNEVTLVSVGK